MFLREYILFVLYWVVFSLYIRIEYWILVFWIVGSFVIVDRVVVFLGVGILLFIFGDDFDWKLFKIVLLFDNWMKKIVKKL